VASVTKKARANKAKFMFTQAVMATRKLRSDAACIKNFRQQASSFGRTLLASRTSDNKHQVSQSLGLWVSTPAVIDKIIRL
jgi:hypothetical protein